MKTINFFRSKLFALTFALMASVSSFAYDEMPDFQVDGLYYNFLEEDNVEVTHPYIPVVPVENVASNTKKKSHAISADDYYNLTNLVIPSTVTYEGKVYNVTRIGFDAFNQCDKLTFVDIPSSVKTIGVGAFNFCSSLTSITLKEGLEHIEWNAFEDCRSLENITFPNSLKTIGNYAFSNTLWYKNHPNGAVYAGNVFYKYKGDIPQNTSFVIKEGTVSISPYAFVKENYHEDYSLVSVSIPNSVEVIGEGAFYRCRALTSIVIPAGVTTIETLAFHYCKALKSVTCEAVNPPALSGSVFLSTPIADATLYVPAESIEAYKTATEWKDFGQILPITWSAECYEFRDFNLGIGLFPRKSSLVYTLYHTDDRTIEPPYVDSVWILDPELDKQNPLHVHTLYAQPGDTIDLSFLEKNKHYILRVHINECQMSRVFLYRVVKWEYKWCNQWNVLWFDGMQFDESASTSHYQLGQDTVIGDYTYRKFTSRTSVRFTEDWKVYVYYEGFDDNDPYTEDLPAGEYLAYDFSAQVGDTLEVFSGIGTYSTYLCVVDDVQQTDIQTALRTITLHKICRRDTDGDGVEEDYDDSEMTWIEGVGSPEGFLISDLPCGWVDGGTNHLLCAYKDDELKYTGTLYDEYGCEYNAEQKPEDLFPTLWGLQRTDIEEHTTGDGKPYLSNFEEYVPTQMNGKLYLSDGRNYLREENNQVLFCCPDFEIYEDIVLYDWTLEIGDTLPHNKSMVHAESDFIVTNVSTVTLLDGKKYKKWTLACGYEYIEGIGAINGEGYGHYLCLQSWMQPGTYIRTSLVCASRDGQLLYQMDDTEMEQLETECLCEYNAEQKPEDLFPTLWGLQRTSCTKTIGENENGTVWGSRSYLMQEIETATIDGKQYLLFGTNNIYDEYCSLWLREENNKILVYSTAQKKDLVLYDFTLNVGDSLSRLYVDYELSSVVDYYKYMEGYASTDPLVVTEVSTITLLDGKEHKKWTFNNGRQYVEGIGSFGACYAHNDFYQLIADAPLYSDVYSQYLVCVSKNGQLLYQMDESEMAQLETECLCEIEPKWSETWCNQWNILSHGYQGPQDPLVAARTSIFWLSNNTVNRDGQEYIPLMCSSSKPDVESTNLIGELRFTEDKQVYFYYDNTEYLLYDFDVQVGDTLDIFGGIELYSYSFVEQKTYPHVITKIDTLDDGRLQITSDAIVIFEDGEVGTFEEKQQQIWIEGLGSINGIVHTGINPGIGGNPAIVMLCAYRDDECVYKTDSNDPYWIDYTQLGCVYNEGDFIEGAFPILSGLQRTVCKEYYGETEDDNSANSTYKQTFDQIFFENDKPYILCNDFLLREEDNMILIYSQTLNKDLVLYDFTLEVGDSLLALYINAPQWDPPQSEDIIIVTPPYNGYVVDHDYNGKPDPVVVTDISTVTLLDGKEHKKWTFNNGMEYVEGIGSFGNRQWSGDFFQLIANKDVPTCLLDEHLVCVSKHNKLLYQMDDAEMEQLETECLCEIEPKWSETWCNQWNILSHGYLGPQDPLAGARTSIYRLSNNTINRNGQEYIPLMCSSSMPNEESTHLVGELRFTEDKQVYFYYAFDETEYLLYDFGAELGDTLELFAGLEFYDYHKTYTHVITDKETLDDGRLQIQADVVIRIDNGAGEYFEEKHRVTWIEGLGSTYGIIFNPSNPGVDGDGAIIMLCAYRDDECVYTTNFSDYKNMGCVYNNDGTVDEDLFPMLAGLQRTVCNEFCGDTEDDNSSNTTYKQTFDKILFERDHPYIYCNSAFLLREENNKILIYSHSLDKDLVLYDFTLEVGDSLPQLYLDEEAKKDISWIYYEYMNVVDYNKYNDSIYPADTLIVTDVSMITLLDGKEYKKWTFNNGMEYVEGIGMYGGRRGGNFFGLIQELVVPCHTGTHLVCVSKNGQLLYQMDNAEMERLGAECLCDYDRGPLKDNAKNGKIGGRPTPTQWNMLEVETKEMDGTQTILRAETFSYTLENDSIVANGKTYYQLARQSTKDTAITKSFVGAIHFSEDEGNRVYFLCDGEEYVLYDFTAEPGDTLEIFAGINNYPQDSTYTHTVTSKDTIENGACRVILEVIFPEETNTTATNTEKVWLAGLGSIDGIVHNAAKRTTNTRSSDTQTTIMLCAWREDDCLYTTDHPDYDTYGCIYNQDHPTAVENTQLPMTDCQKFLRNGQLLIMHEGKTYNVMGMEL